MISRFQDYFGGGLLHQQLCRSSRAVEVPTCTSMILRSIGLIDNGKYTAGPCFEGQRKNAGRIPANDVHPQPQHCSAKSPSFPTHSQAGGASQGVCSLVGGRTVTRRRLSTTEAVVQPCSTYSPCPREAPPSTIDDFSHCILEKAATVPHFAQLRPEHATEEHSGSGPVRDRRLAGPLPSPSRAHKRPGESTASSDEPLTSKKDGRELLKKVG